MTSVYCVLAAIGLIGIFGAATHIEQLAVSDVSVSGVQQLAPESLAHSVQTHLSSDNFELFSRKNIFLYPKHAIEAGLSQEFPRIKTVEVARQSLLASALVVTVEERAPYATWCKDSACFVFDSRGFIFAEKTETPEREYVFYGGLVATKSAIGQVFLEGRLHGVITLMDALKNAGYPPQSFTVSSETDFAITLASGQQLLGSFVQTNDEFLRNLTTTLESESLQGKFETLQYIDLRFGNRVYYK